MSQVSFNGLFSDSTDSSNSSIKIFSSSEEFIKITEPLESDTKVQSNFANFLETKAKNGFGIKDHLKYRYIAYYTADGLWDRFIAFMCLGGLGYFCADVTKSNIEALRQECEFYNQCCKVQTCYLKFSKKPAENFKALQDAYETILKLDPTQHDQINTILNKGLSKEGHIGAAILKHIATDEFAPRGKMTDVSILSAISGQVFLANIQSKYDQGYRGTIRKDEAGVYQQVENRRKIQQSEITSILNNEGTRAIFMSYARAYNEQLNGEDERLLSMNVCDNLSTGFINEGQIDRKINGYNKLILELIQNPTLQIPMAALPPTFQTQKFVDYLDEITSVYQTYQNDSASMLQFNLEHGEARKACELAQNNFIAELKKTKKCTLDELSNLFGDKPHSSLPSASFYLDSVEEKGKFTTSLDQVNETILKRISELNGCVGKNGTTTIAMLKLANDVKEAQIEEAKNLKLYEQAQKAIPSAKNLKTNSNPKKAFEEANTALETWEKSDNILKTAKQAHQNMQKQLASEEAELKALQSSDPKQPLIKKRNAVSKGLKEFDKIVVELSYANILEISSDKTTISNKYFQNIADQVRKLQEQYQTYQEKKMNAMNRMSELSIQIPKTLEKLKKFGVQINEKGQIVDFKFSGFNEEYRKKTETALRNQGPLSANIIKALRIIATPIDKVSMSKSIGKKSDSKNEILLSTSETKVDLSKPIVRNQVKHQVEHRNVIDLGFISDKE